MGLHCSSVASGLRQHDDDVVMPNAQNPDRDQEDPDRQQQEDPDCQEQDWNNLIGDVNHETKRNT